MWRRYDRLEAKGVQALWDRVFTSNDPTQGGCPLRQPLSRLRSLATSMNAITAFNFSAAIDVLLAATAPATSTQMYHNFNLFVATTLPASCNAGRCLYSHPRRQSLGRGRRLDHRSARNLPRRAVGRTDACATPRPAFGVVSTRAQGSESTVCACVCVQCRHVIVLTRSTSSPGTRISTPSSRSAVDTSRRN
eukprot:COSAG02_NODE_8926_length_2398_cov_1.421923_2_plen_192_part_00